MNDIPGMIGFFEEMPEMSDELYINKKSKTDAAIAIKAFSLALPALKAVASWEGEVIHGVLSDLAAANEMKNSQILWPLRIALSGLAVTPGGAVEILDILGKEESIKRIEAASERLQCHNQ